MCCLLSECVGTCFLESSVSWLRCLFESVKENQIIGILVFFKTAEIRILIDQFMTNLFRNLMMKKTHVNPQDLKKVTLDCSEMTNFSNYLLQITRHRRQVRLITSDIRALSKPILLYLFTHWPIWAIMENNFFLNLQII